jgi:predicted AAA+ superfamily ATPase
MSENDRSASPKIYVRDTGLLHTLLRIADRHDLLGHPKMGASWEGFMIEQLLAMGDAEDPWFWGTHRGAELDLFITVNRHRRPLKQPITPKEP